MKLFSELTRQNFSHKIHRERQTNETENTLSNYLIPDGHVRIRFNLERAQSGGISRLNEVVASIYSLIRHDLFGLWKYLLRWDKNESWFLRSFMILFSFFFTCTTHIASSSGWVKHWCFPFHAMRCSFRSSIMPSSDFRLVHIYNVFALEWNFIAAL